MLHYTVKYDDYDDDAKWTLSCLGSVVIQHVSMCVVALISPQRGLEYLV